MTALTRLDNPHIVRLLGVQVRPPAASARDGAGRSSRAHAAAPAPASAPRQRPQPSQRAHARVGLGVQVDLQQEKVYIIMELCQGGELFDRIAECGGLPEDEARRYFVHILSALRHCHQNHVYHRDLKPENILLDGQDNAKVADFGLAAVYQHINDDARYLQHTKVGSVMYAAPEVLTSTAQTGYNAAAADMWSLGIILFSMLSGTLPFQCAAASRCKRYAAVLQQGIQVMCPDTLSPDVTALLARMIHPDPAQRYTPEQALQCAWLSGAGASTSDLAEEVQGRARIAEAQPRSWTIVLHLPEQQPRRGPPGADEPPSPLAVAAAAAAASQAGAGTSAGAGAGACACAAAELSPGGANNHPTAKRKREDGQPHSGEGGELDAAAAATFPPRAASLPGPSGPSGGATMLPPFAAAAASAAAPPPAAPLPPGMPTSSSAGAAASSAAAGAPGGGAAPLAALPLTGCLTEYVQRWGWEPLPRGTEQLLRDILQTLGGLGLQYTLHEERSEPAPGAAAAAAAAAGGIGQLQMGGAGGSAPPTPASSSRGGGARGNRLVVKINFTTLDAANNAATGRPPGR